MKPILRTLLSIVCIFGVCGLVAYTVAIANDGRKVELICFICGVIAVIGVVFYLRDKYSIGKTDQISQNNNESKG